MAPSHIFIDTSPRFGYGCHEFSLNLQDGNRVTLAAGASAVPADGGSSLPPPGGSGKTPGRHHDRSARSSLDWDRRMQVTPA